MSTGKLEGGALGGVDDLYREVILEHFKMPRNKGKLEKANAHADGMNPLCGDQISITVLVDNDKIKDIRFEGHGCAISQSSASMMTAALKGKSIVDAQALTSLFKKVFGVTEENVTTSPHISSNDLGDLEALEGVKKYPVRIKCALLSWNTFLESIANLKK